VDQIPQDREGFYAFKDGFEQAWAGEQTDDIVIDSFVYLAKEKNFEKEWIDSFLKSMEMDLTRKTYQTMDDTLEYIYGSAEVIGFSWLVFLVLLIDLMNPLDISVELCNISILFVISMKIFHSIENILPNEK
jgi:phytoene synthase